MSTQEEQAIKIASQMSAKSYFLSSEESLLNEWSDKSMELMKFTGEVFKKQYELKSDNLVEQYGGKFQDLNSKARKQFEAYCLLSRKVQKKTDEIENIAIHFNKKNIKRNFFMAMKELVEKKHYLRKMEDKAESYYQKYRMRTVMKSWLGMTMDSNKIKIKNDILHKTQIQINKVQIQYEKLIKGLEEALENRLNQLAKQEQQHKQLHDKYRNMYDRSKVNSSH